MLFESAVAQECDLGEFALGRVNAPDFEDVDVVEVVFSLSIGEGREDAVAEVSHLRAVGLTNADSGWFFYLTP